MDSKKFQRTKEDFVCEKCGAQVTGNGYTDHCPHCLWGKHVDVSPGDRASECGGLMEPVSVEQTGNGYRIDYICQKCAHKFIVKSAKDDSFEMMVSIIKKSSSG